MSRADQSFSKVRPKACSSASSMENGSPSALPGPTNRPSSSSQSTRALALKTGTSASGGLTWPFGRRSGVPLTTMELLRPW
jgi:hypothetical protein